MDSRLTDITLLLDRTGSMKPIADEVVGGVNAFVEEQQKAEGEALYTLIQFDSVDPQEVVHDAVGIRDVPQMELEDYKPRAMTPLLDALGHAIETTGKRLAGVPESDRPGKVVFVVFTDGHENSSTDYTSRQIREMVQHQTDVYKWQFVFLGAGIDAFSEGGSVGIGRGTSLSLARLASKGSLHLTSANIARFRQTGDINDLKFTPKQRQETE